MKLDPPGFDRAPRDRPASWTSAGRFAAVRTLADAVLLEGYVLYPYRASAAKNRYRFQFGVLAPRAWSAAGGCESSWLETQLLVRRERGGPALISGAVRFLQLTRRKVERAEASSFVPVDSLEVDGRLLVTWDEGEVREIEVRAPLEVEAETAIPFSLPGGRERELLRDGSGAAVARVTHLRRPVRGRVSIRVDTAGDQLLRVRLRVDNETPWRALGAPRDAVLAASCLSTHLLLGVEGGAFVSLTDPPESARDAASQCSSTRSFPALVGAPGSDDLVLCAPIILPDYAQVAPESPGDFFDATEIDELLTLRTATLTDEEKRQVRATDPRAAALVDRVDDMPPEMMERLHGAVRDLRPSSPELPAGSHVRLRPGARRTDAQDLLYAGRVATIEKVMHDLEGRILYAVTVDDDPAADLHRWYGRFLYFYADEVEPCTSQAAAAEVSP